MGEPVGVEVGLLVGRLVGTPVGDVVGKSVGLEDGTSVGGAVGTKLMPVPACRFLFQPNILCQNFSSSLGSLRIVPLVPSAFT